MKLFERAKLKWREPKEFLELHRKYESARTRWWVQPGCVLLISAMLLLQRHLASFNPQKSPPDLGTALILSLVLGVFIAYGVPWINQLCPSQVRLYSKCLLKGQGNFKRIVAFKEMASYWWLDNDRFHTLCLTSKRGHRTFIGVNTREHRDIIDQTLVAFGVPCVPNEKS